MVTFMCWVPEEPNAISSNLTGVGNKKLSCHRETARRFVTLTFEVIENGAVLIDHTRLSNCQPLYVKLYVVPFSSYLTLNNRDLEKVTEGHSNWYHSKA